MWSFFVAIVCWLIVERLLAITCARLANRFCKNWFRSLFSTVDTGWAKKVSRYVFTSLPNIDRLSQFFSSTFCGKSVIVWLLDMPQHVNCVAALP